MLKPFMRPKVLGLLGWAGVMCARAAFGAEPPLVMLELERCEQLQEKEVRRVFAAELGTRAADAPGKDVTQVTVFCKDAQVTVVVQDPLSQKSLRRSFDLGLSDANGRSRLVAVAAAELVVASWTELDTNPRPQVPPAGAHPPDAATRAALDIVRDKRSAPYEPPARHWYDADTPPSRQFRLVATTSMRSFFKHDGALWGGGVRVGEQRFRHVGWAADALLEEGQLRTRDARYDITTATAGGWLLLGVQTGILTSRIGAGLRAGMVASDPNNGRSTSTIAPWGWPLGVISLTLAVSRYVVLDVAGEAGYAVLPVDGTGITLTGPWISAQFGIGFVLPSVDSAGAEGEEVE
jgi:hypothetical protein